MPFGDFASNLSLPRVIRGLYFPPTHKEICKRESNKFKGLVAIVFYFLLPFAGFLEDSDVRLLLKFTHYSGGRLM